MVLYVVPIPTPPAGFDWSTVVPGHYLWDVTGITATLRTGVPAPTVVADASGNGNDGIYHYITADPPDFVASLVGPPDKALQFSNPAGMVYRTEVNVHPDLIDLNLPFTVMWWEQTVPPPPGSTIYRYLAANAGFTDTIQVFGSNGAGTPWIVQTSTGHDWIADPAPDTYDGTPHMIAVTSDGAAFKLYIDGVLIAWSTVGTLAPLPGRLDGISRFGYNAAAPTVGDEFATFTYELTGGEIATLYGFLGDFASYNNEILASVPNCYYHLDDQIPSTGRQPTLTVTDGTNEVLAIPTGFAAVSTPGPYRYAWQPGLNADTQSTDGTLTTVAIPRLLIPAGYTVGVRTLDIQPGDQWETITLWWDDAFQQSLEEFNPYEYPPGANLRYQQTGT